ncbi:MULTISPECIES: hypothetical protein [unclassified Methanosarcina]|nr:MULTISPECIES: hypothetical protein [unclassified Methanosarcina]
MFGIIRGLMKMLALAALISAGVRFVSKHVRGKKKIMNSEQEA